MASDAITYNATDVSEALARLSNLASEKPICFPEGTVIYSPQDLQQWWQVVAYHAGELGNGHLPETALQGIKVVYQYVETVIISCGAPDSFDIYEVCFETLTKIGFYVQSPASREMLLQVLENVNEVYDVLLSCVETYEWVQPGATRLLRLWMLQVIFACFSASNITGRDLMELTDNDVSGAVSLISFILRCDAAPFQMQNSAGQCLVELTTADSVFLHKREGTPEDTQNEQIAKLTAMLNRHVNGLIKGVIQFDVVEAFGRCICQHQMVFVRTDFIVKHFLTTIHNCLLYCSENQKRLRQHLATQSTIVQDIMVPYVHNILPALFDNPVCGPRLIEWQNLKSTLQTFVVVTFNINVFRPQLRDSDMLPKVCEVPGILTHISMLELLIKICINVDFTKGAYHAHLLSLLQNAFEALPDESKLRLQRRLTSEQSMRLPYSRSSVQAVQDLAFALQLPPGEETAESGAVETRKAVRKNRWRNAKNKSKKRKRLFAMQNTKNKANAQTAADADPGGDDEDEESEEEDMPVPISSPNWESALGAADESGVPQNAVCQLSGAMMHDPVETPEGHRFERAALEDWMTVSATNPLTGQPMTIENCSTATELQSSIQSYQMQMFAAAEIAPGCFDQPTVPEIEEPVPAVEAFSAAPPVITGPSLLGDLPAIEKERKEAKEKKKEKGKIRIESRSVIDCPEDMRCAIDGKVCTNPVRSPYGHLFEKKTLERWVKNCGSVCPITSKPLRLDDCEPDAEMKRKIVKFLKCMS
eukprot:TRINITY_DN67076_c0_g1_i1.p1 TRINITY_DN67076_c0_g1~~TRINITY_DN67076_c0_g1_i1.p1  ORF type:complete len:807 (-),score=148.73 TRINITY_DN67076_c0_g1_i1:324-2606(-)